MVLADRLRELAYDKSMNLKEFCSYVGVSYRTIQNYLAEKSSPNAQVLELLNAKVGVSANWLIFGIEPKYVDAECESTKNGAHEDSEFVQIRRHQVEASAGNGSEVASEDAAQSYAFNRKWLGKRGLKPDTLSVISVRGDSMEPDLNDGDLVLIDLANTDLSDGKIYAVQYSGNLFVKRIQYVPGDTVRLVSRNAQYAPIEIKTPEADGVRVVGRVVASMHEW